MDLLYHSDVHCVTVCQGDHIIIRDNLDGITLQSPSGRVLKRGTF